MPEWRNPARWSDNRRQTVKIPCPVRTAPPCCDTWCPGEGVAGPTKPNFPGPEVGWGDSGGRPFENRVLGSCERDHRLRSNLADHSVLGPLLRCMSPARRSGMESPLELLVPDRRPGLVVYPPPRPAPSLNSSGFRPAPPCTRTRASTVARQQATRGYIRTRHSVAERGELLDITGCAQKSCL